MTLPESTRALIANRPFVTLLAARTLAMLGMAFSPVALAFGILRLPGADAGTLSLVLVAQTAPMVVFMLVGGVIADRYPRAVVMLTGQAMSALGWGSIGLMMLLGYAPVWLLCLAAAVAGTAGAATYPALNGIIPDLVPQAHRQQANAWLGMGASTARLVGLVSGGAVVVLVGGGWAMVVAASTYLAAGLFTLALPRVKGSLADAAESPLRQLREGWREFRSRQWLWVAVLQWSVMNMMLQAAHGVFGPVVAEHELGGAGVWSMLLAAEAVGALVGVTIALTWKPQRPILTATLVILPSGVPALLLGASTPVPLIALAFFVLGIGFELFGVWWLTTMQAEVPPESISRVSSYDALGSLMLGPVGLALAGPATVAFGVHPALIGAGVISTLTALLALLSPDLRRLRARHPATVEVSGVVAAA